MKRLVALYPKRWRDRYGAELVAFIENEPKDLALLLDLLRGIVGAHLRPGLGPPRFAFAGPDGPKAFRRELGFRQVGAKLARPVSLTRGGRTLTVQELVSTPDGVDLIYDLVTPPNEITPRSQLPKLDVVTLRVGRADHRVHIIRSATSNASTSETGKLVRTLGIRPDPPLPSGARELELKLKTATFGEWSLRAQLVPFPSAPDVPARKVGASDSREGVTLTVVSVALTDETTAIELDVVADGARIHGIGGFMGLRAGTTALTLRDQTGRTYAEHARGHPRDQFPGSPMARVAVFDRLGDDARELELEVPFVCVDERHEIEVMLPVTMPVDLAFGPYPIRVLSSGQVESTDPFKAGAALRVDFDLGGWQGDRRILTFAGPLRVDGECPGGTLRGPTMKPAEPEPVHQAEIPLNEPLAARALTFSGPTVQVRGPWRVKFERPLP